MNFKYEDESIIVKIITLRKNIDYEIHMNYKDKSHIDFALYVYHQDIEKAFKSIIKEYLEDQGVKDEIAS